MVEKAKTDQFVTILQDGDCDEKAREIGQVAIKIGLTLEALQVPLGVALAGVLNLLLWKHYDIVGQGGTPGYVPAMLRQAADAIEKAGPRVN